MYVRDELGGFSECAYSLLLSYRSSQTMFSSRHPHPQWRQWSVNSWLLPFLRGIFGDSKTFLTFVVAESDRQLELPSE